MPKAKVLTAKESDLSQQILDAALELAEQSSWERVRLFDIAAKLQINLDQVQSVCSQKDDLTDAWFDRADRAMLKDAASPEFLQLPTRGRLHRAIMSWLNAMSMHKRLTADMLRYKFEVGHIHLQILGIMRISRTVQWIMEAAHRDAAFTRRILEEIVLTAIYLAAFSFWLRDDSLNSERTARFLDSMLEKTEAASHFLPQLRSPGSRHVRSPSDL
jgi:ubiquinone biosynthesis protein COQ9